MSESHLIAETPGGVHHERNALRMDPEYAATTSASTAVCLCGAALRRGRTDCSSRRPAGTVAGQSGWAH